MYSLNEMYAVNLAHLSSGSDVSTDSLDAICQENNAGTEEPTALPELCAATSKRYALTLLSRIADLINANLDNLLTELLPSTTEIHPSNSHSGVLTKWGNIINKNLLRTGSTGFIEDVPILRIVDPLALANLHAAAVWPTLTTRIQLLEGNKCVLEDLIIRSSKGFSILKTHTSHLEQRFLKLIEFILSRSSSAHLLIPQDSSENVDPDVEKREVSETPHIKLEDVTNTTIPFIDETRLIASPTLADLNVESRPSRGQCSPSFEDAATPIRHRVSNTSSSASAKKLEEPSSDEATITAIQLALLLLPLELRFQLQVFLEQAQEIVANSKRHLRPEITLEYVQPSLLAYWFSARFFPWSAPGFTGSGRALLEFLLSHPNPLALFKPPNYCLGGGLFASTAGNAPSPHRQSLDLGSPTLEKAPAMLAGVKKNFPAGGRREKMKATVDVAVSTEDLKSCRHSLLSVPPLNLGPGGYCEKVAPEEATSIHVSQMLEYFESILKHKSIPIATKLSYVKQFEKTHPDIFWLRFKSEEEARECIEDLKRQAKTQESHSQSPSRFADRLLHLFKRAPRSRSAARSSGQPSVED